MPFFEYAHLTHPILREVSHRVEDVAWAMYSDERLDGAELTVGLRKLLEAKDCFVRAALSPKTQGS
jgi:hypothetical protein